MRKSLRKAFTLVEIMIVVLIIGVLLAIAVPNFVRARESSRAKACVSNLKQIDSAKEQLAMDSKLGGGATITNGMTDLLTYLKKEPTCPSGGTYTIGAVGTDPTCSHGGTGANAHAL
ncbi:MAG: competence type IV pilus major pilin ComGC [Armatimonadaceae bacterium]